MSMACGHEDDRPNLRGVCVAPELPRYARQTHVHFDFNTDVSDKKVNSIFGSEQNFFVELETETGQDLSNPVVEFPFILEAEFVLL